jgi:hypothetical protein
LSLFSLIHSCKKFWIYGKTDTFKSHIFRFAINVAKFGVYFYKFPDAGNHLETQVGGVLGCRTPRVKFRS